MPELRRDPVGGRWVIIATERAFRPQDYHLARRTPKGGFCPFCEGNEDRTPPEILAYRAEDTQPNGPGWKLRVVPNKYPALQTEGETKERSWGVYQAMDGVGAHEVIIETPKHLTSPTEMPVEAFYDVVRCYRDRVLALKEDRRLAYALVFKNVGAVAGGSLEHTHSQLISTPVVPKRVGEEMDRCMDFFLDEGRCLLCAIVEQSLADGEHVVINEEGFLAIAPYASRFPFEVWILPKQHASHFEDSPLEMLEEFARVTHDVLLRLDGALNEPPYNYLLHTSPFTFDNLDHYHWHLEVIPRLTEVAGFEWGTGFHINPVVPARAAEHLRAALRQKLPAQTDPAPP